MQKLATRIKKGGVEHAINNEYVDITDWEGYTLSCYDAIPFQMLGLYEAEDTIYGVCESHVFCIYPEKDTTYIPICDKPTPGFKTAGAYGDSNGVLVVKTMQYPPGGESILMCRIAPLTGKKTREEYVSTVNVFWEEDIVDVVVFGKMLFTVNATGVSSSYEVTVEPTKDSPGILVNVG